MNEIKITNQKELDLVPLDFEGQIIITGGTMINPIVLSRIFENAEVFLIDKSVAMLDSSVVKAMRDSSVVQAMWGSSVVQDMWDSSVVQDMWDSSVVQDMRGSSVVQAMRDSSVVQAMLDSSVVQAMRDSSVVQAMWGVASVLMVHGKNKITRHGQNLVRVYKSNQGNLLINLSDDSNLIVLQDPEPNFKSFRNNYPIQMQDDKTAIMYKAVHKSKEGIYFSSHNNEFVYEIGKEHTEKCDPKVTADCSYGIHVAERRWAINWGNCWDDMALLECHVPIDCIVVPAGTDGKIRTSKCTVVREIPKEEFYA